MKTRIISGLIMLPLLILLIFGGIPLYLGGLVLMLIALHEFYSAFKQKGYNPLMEVGYSMAIFILIANFFSWDIKEYAVWMFVMFLISIVYVLKQKVDVIDVSLTFSGILYVCLCFNFIILTRDRLSNGYLYVWLIFIIAFATDIFAYFVGRKFGKKKLLPEVSPKKTVEGSLGGICASIVFSVIFAAVFNMAVIPIAFMGLFGSIIAQMGDLIASSIKRYNGIKDFGKLIPGHGGVLDRFDSVLLVAPYVYLSITFFNHIG